MTKEKLTLRIALSGFIAYFVGSGIYQLLGVNNKYLYILSILVGAGITGLSTNFYLKKKYPKIVNDAKMEQHDERGQFISYKAASYILNLIFVIAVIAFLVISSLGQEIIYYSLGVLFICVIIFYLVVRSYLDNKN